jgi:acetate kinase
MIHARAPLLVLNLGSTTLKSALFAPGDTEPARRIQQPITSGEDPLALLSRIVEALSLEHMPGAIAHRIVHGGDATGARLLDEAEMSRLEQLAPLAPLHQSPALDLVRAAARKWPGAKQYGAYDTSWHAGLPARSRRLPVPATWDALGVRRYGFHGLAFASAMRILEALAPERASEKVVIAHLGGGASLCAVHAGRSVDTTMSMTPLDGLPMATRAGSLDPGAMLFLMRTGLGVDEIERALYRESGLRGISQQTGNVADLLAAPADPDAALALEVFAMRIAQGVAAMAVALGGIDDLVFTGGVGFHVSAVRTAVVAQLACLGIAIDPTREAETRISPRGASVCVWRLEIDEQREIALACTDIA